MNKKTCIFESFDNFKKICCGGLFADIDDFDVDFDIDNGIYFCGIGDNEVYKRLADYYRVKTINSIHTDHSGKTGVWICYEGNFGERG